jgi:hypothetical protein
MEALAATRERREAMVRRIVITVLTLAALAMAVGAGWKPGWGWH